MIREFNNHKTAYFILVLFLVSFSALFMSVWPNREQERLLIISMSVFYFVWGVLVHKRADHISVKIMLEYLAISILAGSLLLLMTM